LLEDALEGNLRHFVAVQHHEWLFDPDFFCHVAHVLYAVVDVACLRCAQNHVRRLADPGRGDPCAAACPRGFTGAAARGAHPILKTLHPGSATRIIRKARHGAQVHRVQGPAPSFPEERVLTHREQAGLVRGWLEKRFETMLPEMMRREGIDMWIIISREYNDDPVFRSLAPFETYSSRRRTILVFHDRGEELGVEALSVGRFDYQGLYTVVPTHNEEQFEGLRELVEERDPRASASTCPSAGTMPTA
jgi:hypothetical protein